MTLQDIENALEAALLATQKLAPLVGPLAGPAGAAIGAAVSAIAGAAATILPEVESDAAILATGDITKIRALQASIQAQNQTLIAELNAS